MKVKIILVTGQEVLGDKIISIEPELDNLDKVIGVTLKTKDGEFYYAKDKVDKIIIEDVG